MQLPGTRPTSTAYGAPVLHTSGTRPTFRAYMQPLGIGLLPATHMLLDIGPTSVSHTQPLTGPAHLAVYPLLSTIDPPVTTITISIGYGRELSNLAKFYTDDIKYNSCNNSFTFKLAIFYNICVRANVLHEAKMKVFSTMLKGLALDYYYLNISTNTVTMNFDQVCISIRNYFKGAKYK